MGRVEDEFAYQLERALYHNQFILGAFFVDEHTSWRKTRIRSSLCLATHPNLNVYQANHGKQSITLIGYILDPNNSDTNDSDIINNLIGEASDFDRVLDRSGSFGGRWILIIDDGKQIRLFHDAAGLRQVFYTDTHNSSELWCASQPGMIAERLKLGMDSSASDFLNSLKQREREYWWPGDSSPYKEIKHLTPNHYLNLDTGSSHRYWPNRPLEKLPLEEVAGRSAKTFQGLMESASKRYALAVSLTAGWDSRLVLAASKGIRDKVSYITVRQKGMPGNHADIMVPSFLVSKFGLKHDIVEAPPAMDEKFMSIFQKNVPFSHEKWGPDAQAIMKYNSHTKVTVTGSASEIVRCFYRRTFNRKITPQLLSALTGMGNDLFAVRSYEKWLKEITNIASYNILDSNYNMLDLFYWEQRCGNWLAMCQLEFDSAWKDIFTPFNCRELLVNMLALDEKYRSPPKYELYREVISQLWPDVLSAPINPHKRMSISFLLRLLRIQLRPYTPAFIKRLYKRTLNY